GGGGSGGGRPFVSRESEPGAANESEGGGSATEGAAGPYFGPGRLPASRTPSHGSCLSSQRSDGVHFCAFATASANNEQLDGGERGQPQPPGSAERAAGSLLECHQELYPTSSYPQYIPPQQRSPSTVLYHSTYAGQPNLPLIRVRMDAGTTLAQLRQRQAMAPDWNPSVSAAAAMAPAAAAMAPAAAAVENAALASRSRSVSISASAGSTGITGELPHLRERGAQIAGTPMVVAAAVAAAVAETHGSVNGSPPAPSFIQDQAIHRATTLQQWLQPRQFPELSGQQPGHAAAATAAMGEGDLSFLPELPERATWASPRAESAFGSGLGFHVARSRRRYTMATGSLVVPEPEDLGPVGGELATTAISASTHHGFGRGRAHRLSSIGRNSRLSGAGEVATAAAMPTSLITPVVHVDNEVCQWQGPPPPRPAPEQSVMAPRSAPLPVPVVLLPAVLPNRPDAEGEGEECDGDIMYLQPL
ncbi:hypothetical protein Vretifemale_20619, partial [Volvox reticuliferus]